MGGGPGRASPAAGGAAAASTASAAADASDVGSAQFSWRRGEWSSSRRGRDADSAAAASPSATRESVGGVPGTWADMAAEAVGGLGQDVAAAVGGGEKEEEKEAGFKVGADLMADFKRR